MPCNILHNQLHYQRSHKIAVLNRSCSRVKNVSYSGNCTRLRLGKKKSENRPWKETCIDKESDRTKGGKRNLNQRELVNIEIRNVEYADAGLTVEKILTVLQHVILFRCSGSVLSANS